jgi:hypothetical protein
MRQYIAFVIAPLACAGCSLIYNPSNLSPASDAQIDAEIIDPMMLEIDEVVPDEILEGQGAHGSQPALVVIHGKNIIDRNTVVEITPVSGTVQLDLGTPVIAANGHWIAVPITTTVDEMLEQGELVMLDVKVTQELPAELGGGTPTATLKGKLALRGLKELTAGATPEVTGSDIDTARLEKQYSRVDLSGIPSARFVGGARAIIRSVSSISAVALVANGAGGANSGAGGGGAPARVGGCGGGAAGSGGDCGPSGGEAGAASGTLSTVGGGGGGGFATEGDRGSGSISGRGGSATGDVLVATYDGPLNRAGGGGGGGNPSLAGKGGGGGGGGGSIELSAGGDLSVASITADGGAGGSGGAGGGGGGGAGGLVLLRAGGALTVTGSISVAGGPGGDGAGDGDGGKGSDGRVRWDAATAAPPTVTATDATLHRGASFQLDTRVFRSATPSITVIGTASDRFDVYWDQKGTRYTGASYSIGAAGATIAPTLREGFNRLCFTLAGGTQGTGEADTCVDVAFLP